MSYSNSQYGNGPSFTGDNVSYASLQDGSAGGYPRAYAGALPTKSHASQWIVVGLLSIIIISCIVALATPGWLYYHIPADQNVQMPNTAYTFTTGVFEYCIYVNSSKTCNSLNDVCNQPGLDGTPTEKLCKDVKAMRGTLISCVILSAIGIAFVAPLLFDIEAVQKPAKLMAPFTCAAVLVLLLTTAILSGDARSKLNDVDPVASSPFYDFYLNIMALLFAAIALAVPFKFPLSGYNN